jgi:hypothetical protein
MENLGILELSFNEMLAIEGGKPIGYYIGFTLGAIAGTAVSLLSGFAGGLNGQHI